MPLTETETKIVKNVLDRFLTKKEPTPKHFLVIKHGDPDALSRLEQANVLESLNNQAFRPKAPAFHYCADDDTLREAKRSVEVVARVLHSLYTEDLEKEKTQFSISEIETRAAKLHEGIRPETIKLGLYLIRDFYELGCTPNMNPNHLECPLVTVSLRIVTIKNFDTLWEDHMRLCDPTPASDAASKLSDDPNILLSALRRVCTDAELEDLLVNAHNKKPHKLKVSAAFEAHVGWLLGLLGFSTIVLGEYERIVAPETKVPMASVDILAASQAEKSLILAACTLNPPKPEDFSNLRHAREIFRREVFGGKSVEVIPVVFTAALGCAPCETITGTFDTVPIVDGDALRELLQLLRNQKQAEFLSFLSNRSTVLPFGLGDY